MNIKNIFSTFCNSFKGNQKNIEIEKDITDCQLIKQKCVRVINENNEEILQKQFQQRTSNNKALISIHETTPTIYHYWYDCYEDWSDEFVKDFSGWKIKDLKNLNDCRECKRCQERDYRNRHPNLQITGYDFHYYFEDL